MTRLIQIVQNTFIRLTGLLSVIFQSVVAFISNIGNTAANLLGLNNPNYFLDTEETKSSEITSNQPSITTQSNVKTETSTAARRRPNAKMEYYLKMAQEIKKN